MSGNGLVIGNIDLGELLDGMGKVDPSGSGKFIAPGKYLLQVESFEFKKGYKGTSAIGSNKIVKIFSSDDADAAIDDPANLVENITGKNPAIAKANLKAYLLAVCGGLYQQVINPRQVDERFVFAVAQPTQPLKGVFVICEAFKKAKVSKPEESITVKNWRPIFDAELAQYGLAQPKPPAAA